MIDDGSRRWRGGETALGGLLLLLGIVVLLGQAFEVDLGRVGWPFFVIVPGLGLLGLGLAAAGRSGEALATAGGVVTWPAWSCSAAGSWRPGGDEVRLPRPSSPPG